MGFVRNGLYYKNHSQFLHMYHGLRAIGGTSNPIFQYFTDLISKKCFLNLQSNFLGIVGSIFWIL